MNFTPQEEKIVKRKVWFDRFMIITRLMTLVGVIAIAVAGQFYYADLAQKQAQTDQRVIELIEKLAYDRQQSQLGNEESHGEMTKFLKCALLLIANDKGGNITITENDLTQCEVGAQEVVIRPTPAPQPTGRSSTTNNTTNNNTTNNQGNQGNQGAEPQDQGLIPNNIPILGGL